jgi:RNA polymerase sigma-B factor
MASPRACAGGRDGIPVAPDLGRFHVILLRAEAAMAAICSGIASVGISAGPAATAAGGARRDLAGLEDRELLAMIRSLPRSSELRGSACAVLVSRHSGLVWSCVRQYARGPEPAEDLAQVGYLGLMKAINTFDPAFGRSLVAYAHPYVSGEIKRHFRDKRWPIHVERSVQELVLEVREATGQLTQELGRAPAESDLARHLGVSCIDLRAAQKAEIARQPWSLDAPLSGRPEAVSLAEFLGEEDPRVEHMLGMQAVATHWGELTEREQKVLLMRFYGGMTQAQIGQQFGISQVQVSRLLARALGYLRPRLFGGAW